MESSSGETKSHECYNPNQEGLTMLKEMARFDSSLKTRWHGRIQNHASISYLFTFGDS